MTLNQISHRRAAAILCLLCLLCFVCSSCGIGKEDEITKEDIFFSSFSNFNHCAAKFRVGAETDTFLHHFKIKAATIAHFDDSRYEPRSVYILKHKSNDSLVIKTDDAPLLSHEEFKDFYARNKVAGCADTIVDSHVFDQFFLIEHDEVVNVESFEHLPFLFLDVSFNDYPSLLVREDVGHGFYFYKVYAITPGGFHKISFEPYSSIKSRTNSWCLDGSTEFDYKNKTITVFNLFTGSCSDHGTLITDIYKLNPKTEKFDKKQIVNNYDHH